MPALAELEAAWLAARADPAYRAELPALLRDFCGRPTPLYLAERLSEAAGRPVWLKREDLMHTGAHKLNNALGQTLLAKRMGKPRIIAETGAGQHGVATATACALLGLECVVYMGTEDMRRQSPTSSAWGCSARRSSRRRGRAAHAQGGGLRGDPRLGRERRRHALRHRLGVGPAPFPALVRDLQRVIGDEARAQMLERAGRCPSASSPASAAARTRSACSCRSSTTPRRADRRRGRGRGARHRAPRRAADDRRPRGVLHGAFSAIMQDEDGQVLEAHSISAGLDYPGAGPSTRICATPGRARYEAVTDARRSPRSAAWRSSRGSSRRSSPRTRRLGARLAPAATDALDLVCLSGRGDKDLAEVLELGVRASAPAHRARSRPRSRPRGAPR